MRPRPSEYIDNDRVVPVATCLPRRFGPSGHRQNTLPLLHKDGPASRCNGEKDEKPESICVGGRVSSMPVGTSALIHSAFEVFFRAM